MKMTFNRLSAFSYQPSAITQEVIPSFVTVANKQRTRVDLNPAVVNIKKDPAIAVDNNRLNVLDLKAPNKTHKS